jgi:membrane protein implicated in regulation of membrane protease activity
MSTKPLHSSSREHTPRSDLGAGPYRPVWACLPLMLALSGAVMLLFGLSWWTALVVVLLLACPASMAVAIYVGLRPLPDSVSRRLEDEE